MNAEQTPKQQPEPKPKKSLSLSVKVLPKQQNVVCDQYGYGCGGC